MAHEMPYVICHLLVLMLHSCLTSLRTRVVVVVVAQLTICEKSPAKLTRFYKLHLDRPVAS